MKKVSGITDDEVNLTDLIDVDTLQRVQDAFSLMTGIAALTTDIHGVAVTKGSNFSDFCMKYTRPTEAGRIKCEECDRQGAEMAMRRGKSCAYFCHAGLVDFAAPIMAGGKMVGCFIGGQVLTTPAEESQIRQVADEIGVDPEEYLEAASRIRIVEKEEIDHATQALYVIANVLSDMAYGRHEMILKNIELEKASRMKSDFLANMSHEIRTPMNAVIGMAEMALREDLTDEAKSYISQIKSSGQTLLTIINDILDFSKIESGKMDITDVEYEPMSLVNDLVNIIMTRIGNKHVELTMDVNPDIPHELFGDNIRIKQVMVNIANNAVKFTQEGCVHLKMDFQWIDEDNIELQVAIEDTGMGIKPEDMDNLFQSFSQLDSKRNRNVEGTGLGLAICKQLLTLMNGQIYVESEYGKGSTFSFTLPQKVTKKEPSIGRTDDTMVAAGLLENEYNKKQILIDMERFGFPYTALDSAGELFTPKMDGVTHLFIEQTIFTDTVQDFVRSHPDISCVLLINFRATHQYKNLPNLLILKKPLYALNLAGIVNGSEFYAKFTQMEMDDFDFIAPDAEVLIVDDNAINLTVSQGLLEPLEMKIDTALSGKEAVDKIIAKHYDIVFMDHMMPGMDGVETTHVIRRMLGENGQIPIIALTANAVDGTQEMFLKEGMNDFVAKPIELKVITSKIKKWLPPEKMMRKTVSSESESHLPENQKTEIEIEGLDVRKALKMAGTEKLFWKILQEYYRVIDKKCTLIRESMENEEWKEYTIEVHSLKSASRQIGADALADKAARMEQAGNAGEIDLIRETTPGMLEEYAHYKEILAPFFPEEKEQAPKESVDADKLRAFFAKMREAMDNLDMDAMDSVVEEMDAFSYPGGQDYFFGQLKEACSDIDTERCESILQDWEKQL